MSLNQPSSYISSAYTARTWGNALSGWEYCKCFLGLMKQYALCANHHRLQIQIPSLKGIDYIKLVELSKYHNKRNSSVLGTSCCFEPIVNPSRRNSHGFLTGYRQSSLLCKSVANGMWQNQRSYICLLPVLTSQSHSCSNLGLLCYWFHCKQNWIL